MKKIIIAQITAKAGCEEKLLAAGNTLVAGSRAEPGNDSYELLRTPESPEKFRFVEIWKNRDAVDAHFATPHFRLFVKQLGDLVAEAPVITIYDIAGEKIA